MPVIMTGLLLERGLIPITDVMRFSIMLDTFNQNWQIIRDYNDIDSIKMMLTVDAVYSVGQKYSMYGW